MNEVYGIDLSDGILARRSARWLQVRLGGLLHAGTRLHGALWPPERQVAP